MGEGRRGVESLGSCELLVRVWVGVPLLGEGAGGLGFWLGAGVEGGGGRGASYVNRIVK